VMKSPLVV